MDTKLFVIKDNATTIRVMAVQVTPTNPEEEEVILDAGFDAPPFYLMRLPDGKAIYDRFSGNDATMSKAHRLLEAEFGQRLAGETIDISDL
jgi:hypothetical protein